MALPALTYVQRDFSAGQVTEKAARRDDLKLQRAGLKTSANTRLLASGALGQRAGREAFMPDGGRTETIRFSDTLYFYFTFTEGQVVIRDSSRAVVNTVTGLPWTNATLGLIRYAVAERDVVIFYPGMRPRVLRYGVSVTPGAGIGTPFGDMNNLANAFDGTQATHTTKNSATSAYVGLNLSASPQRIAGCVAYPTSYGRFRDSDVHTITLTLRGKNGSPPSSASDGTSLGTANFTDGSTQGRAITSNDSTTLWDFLWLQVAQSGGSQTMHVGELVLQLFTATVEDQWSLLLFAFDETPEGAQRQPYIRYSPKGITLTPSARTGTINVTFSGPVLDSAHAGVAFRYHGRELRIISVSSPTAGTAIVKETLPPLRRVDCGNANARDSFQLGQVAIGETTGAEGLVVAQNSTQSLDIIVYKGDNFASGERIASATGLATVASTPSEVTTPAASTVWDEAVMSDYRGWPRAGAYDRSRLMLFDFPQLQRAISWGAVGAPFDHRIGAEADDGFMEFAPGSGRVLHVEGGADQYVLTDTDAFYIPISESNPLAPGRVAFRRIAAVGAANIRPAPMHEGIVYVAKNGRDLIGIVPTGQTSFPYRLANLSEFHSDVLAEVKGLAAMSGGLSEAEQYLWVCLTNGTALVGRFDPSNEWIGLVPISGAGLVQWISSLAGEVLFDVQYAGTATLTIVERHAPDQYLDGAILLNDPDSVLDGDPGDGPLWMYAGLSVDIMEGVRYLGRRAVDADGDVVTQSGDDFSGETVRAGFGWVLTARPYLPNAGEGEERGQRQRRRRVKRAGVTVQSATKFTFMGREFGSDTEAVSDTFRAPGQGRAFDPEIVLVKSTPGPITVVELNGAVTT